MKLNNEKLTIPQSITSMHEYKRFFRKFNLNSLIEKSSRKSIDILYNKNSKIKAVMEGNFSVYTDKYKIENFSLPLTAWDLIDLIYDSINYTNDFIGSNVISDNDFFVLVDALHRKSEMNSEVIADNEGPNNEFFLYLYGFAGEQFKFQYTGKSFSNANRELYILFECSKRTGDLNNVEELVKQITGTDWVTINTVLYLLWAQSTITPYIEPLKKTIQWSPTLSEKVFDSTLKKYTATYSEIRTSTLKRQILYSKPYILTDHNELLCSSCYLSFFLFEHSINWILRDYFYHNTSKSELNPFPSNFGFWFEEYFKELLSSYVDKTNFYRIEEDDNKKRADWSLKLNKFNFLIEQKSSLLGLLAKQQDSDVTVIKKYSKQIIQAIKQLSSTEHDFNKGKCIKIILVYEDYLKSDYLDYVFNLPSLKIENDNYYWIVTIAEMEMLLDTYKSNPNLFINIIEEKIYRETHTTYKGRSLLEIMSEKGIKTNPYVKQEKIHKYNDIIIENIKSLLKSDSQ